MKEFLKRIVGRLRMGALKSCGGNFFTEHALGIVITVVIGVILFAAINLVFKDMVIPGIKDKITDLFLTT